MGWFSPVKGSYPSLAQVDKTLPLVSDVDYLERGMVVELSKDADGNPVWDVSENGSGIVYVALTDLNDPTAGFAGTSFDPKGGKPAITAIDLHQDGEYETDMIDGDGFEVGGYVGVADGMFIALASDSQSAKVGVVTAAPKSRWINNAIATPPGEKDRRLAYRTGARSKVIRFKTIA